MTNFFQKNFFQNISKTVRDIENTNIIKFVGLFININLISGQMLISPTVFKIQGSEKSQITPPLYKNGDVE